MIKTTQALQSHFGFSTFREGQEEVINKVLEGHSCLAVFPTGSGKSLCYQLPALMNVGLTVVISPLLALMKDQEENLRLKGIAARRLDSSLHSSEVSEIYSELSSQAIKILFVSPERFSKASFLTILKPQKISLIAIDEVHCISEWGHSFRPDYLKIAKSLKTLTPCPILALTATATPRVSRDICRSFKIAPHNHIQTGFHRPHLTLEIQTVTQEKRDEALLALLKKHQDEVSIIYVTRQMTTEFLTTYLKRHGISKVRSYHAGMGSQKRQEIQEEFMSGKCRIIIATIAFGMGIDKADIRRVYHYNVPKSFENYIQETGRAGRDRKHASCLMLACPDDFRILENFSYARRPSNHALQEFSSILLGSAEVLINMYEVSTSLDIKKDLLELTLVFLELQGLVKPLGSRFDQYQISLLQPLQQISQGRNSNQKKLLKNLLSDSYKHSKRPNVYLCKISEHAPELEVSEKYLLTLLRELEVMGEVSLKPSKFLRLYKLTKKGAHTSAKALTDLIEEFFTKQEKLELGRLEQMAHLIYGSECIEQTLLHYFGEPSDPCNNCSKCLSKDKKSAPKEPPITMQTISDLEIELLHTLHQEQHASLSTPLQLTKFLCGITSPASTRARLTTQHDLFGALEHHPFQEILAHCKSLP